MQVLTTDNPSVAPSVDDTGTHPGLYYYDLRVEVLERSSGGRVQLIQIFHRLVEEIEKLGVAMIMCDAHKKAFEPQDIKTMKDFATRFNVTSVSTSPAKALMGFSIDSTKTLTYIKNQLIDFLRDNRTFLRVHKGGLDKLKQTFIGYFLNVSPRVASPDDLYSNLTAKILHSWELHAKKFPIGTLKSQFPNLLSDDGELKPIPFIIQNGQVFSKRNQSMMKAEAMVVHAPTDVAAEIIKLVDHTNFDDNDSIEEFIPGRLIKTEPETYYKLVCIQAKYIDAHRRVQIMYVPPTAVHTVKNSAHKTLPEALDSNQHITRVAYDHMTQRLLVSTTEPRIREVRAFIDRTLTEFPYNAKRVGLSDQDSLPSTTSQPSRFQKLISAHTVTSEDLSTIKSTRRFNAWAQKPPPEIVVDFDAAFPPLRKSGSVEVPDANTLTTTSQMTDMITTAIAKQDEKWEKRMHDLIQMQIQQQQTIQALTAALSQNKEAVIAPTPATVSTTDSTPAQSNSMFITRTELEPFWKVLEHMTTVLDRLDNKGESPRRKQSKPQSAQDEPISQPIAAFQSVSRQLNTHFQSMVPQSLVPQSMVPQSMVPHSLASPSTDVAMTCGEGEDI